MIAALALASGQAQALETQTESAPIANAAVVAQNYSVGVIAKNDAAGSLYGPYVTLALRQKLFEDWTADILLRAFKPASTDSDVTSLSMERAQLGYSRSWLNIAAGRRDLGNLLSPSPYFGSYLLMGESTQDVASVTLRLRLSGDVPDSEAAFSNQEIALSGHFVPNPVAAGRALYDGSQGLMIAQLFVGLDTWGVLSRLMFNVSQFNDAYFRYSSLSGSPAFEGSYSQTWARNYRFFVNFGVQNPGIEGTSALTVGNESQSLQKYVKVADKFTIEYQIPLATSNKNAFTGGSSLSPTSGTLPQGVLFARIHNRIGSRTPTEPARFFYGVAATNAPADYTLSRLRSGATSVTVPPAFGTGPKVEYLPFRALDYNTYSVLGYAGYEF
jgi:hypothetical protein